MSKNVIWIAGLVIIGIISCALFLSFYVNAYVLPKKNSAQDEFVAGEVLVTMKPYASVGELDTYIAQNPGLERSKQDTLSLPSFGTLSLKNYQELTKKVIALKSGWASDPEILDAEKRLRAEYESVKTNPRLESSNIWDSFYSNTEPKDSYFAVIHYFFKSGVPKTEQDEFFRQHADLQIIEKKEESQTYTVMVPRGKEKYWVGQFSAQPFVERAWVNGIGHVTDSVGLQ